MALVAFVAGCAAGQRGSPPPEAGSLPASEPEDTRPVGSGSPVPTTSPLEEGDPAGELAGLPAEAVDEQSDAILRIGADGFRLPENEVILDVHRDRVLSGRTEPAGNDPVLVVRGLDGNEIRVVDPGMKVPQVNIVRGDDLYFAGIDADLHEPDLAIVDRGVWRVRGDGDPEELLAPTDTSIYHELLLSPDGRTLAVSRCGTDACDVTLLAADGASVEIPKPGIVALGNDVAVLIEEFDTFVAYAAADGAELWRRQTEGLYLPRYVTGDGRTLVSSAVEDDGDGDGDTQDQLRIETIALASGEVRQTVLVPYEGIRWWLMPTLSTDRYATLTSTVLPNLSGDPTELAVVDLVDGRVVDLDLQLGPLAAD